jgi:hypothetical protein
MLPMPGLMLAAGSFPLCSPIPSPSPDLSTRRLRRRIAPAPVLILGGLLAAALWLAPEAPQDQAAICQRHNGVAACRVW